MSETRAESQGSVGMSIDVRVDAAEMASWKPETVRAFFAGMSLVLSARRAGDFQSRMESSLAVLRVVNDEIASVATEMPSFGGSRNE